MIRNEETYKQAIEFRKRGFTYSEIAKICDISVSTASNWLSKKAFSKKVAKDNAEKAARENKKRMVLLNKMRKSERETVYEDAIRTAETEYKHYKLNPLFVAGLMLYIAQGDRSDASRIRLTTSQMVTHRIFIRFCIEFLGVDKAHIQFWLLLYKNQKEEASMKRWSKQTGLSLAQFGKTQLINQTTQTLHNGTGNTIIGNTVLKKKLMRWIELSLKEL